MAGPPGHDNGAGGERPPAARRTHARPRRRARRLLVSLVAIAVLGVAVEITLEQRGEPLPRRTTSTGATASPKAVSPTSGARAVVAPTPGSPGPSSTGPSSTGPSPTDPPTTGDRQADRPPVLVLNNSKIAGLAAQVTQTLSQGGWPVATPGNFRGRISETTVYYEPGQEQDARALAAQFPKITRVLPRFDGLPGSGLTVVVTRYWDE